MTTVNTPTAPHDQSPAYLGPGSWTAADVAGYVTAGIPQRVMRQVIARWPHPGDYEAAWTRADRPMLEARLPRPIAPLTGLAGGDWVALAGTPDYPTILLDAPAAPLLLFGRGDLAALRPGLAVVGSRQMSAYGRAVAETSVAAAAESHVPVHSGAALGVDAAAAEAALAARLPTVAVIATGPDVPFPAEHAGLLARVADAGAVVSEHPFATTETSASAYSPAPIAARLVARNRIIAGLSMATVCAEAAGRSGTMHTVWATLSMGRPVLVALPRPHARHLPGAQAPLGLSAPIARTAEQLTAMGAPPAVAAAWAGRHPLAAGAADRDELVALVRFAVHASPHHRPAEHQAAARRSAQPGPAALRPAS